MKKTEYIETLEENLSGRIIEITSLKNIMENGEEKNNDIFIRLGVLLIYAHVEGFIKDSLLDLVDYLNKQELKIKEVNFKFKAISLEDDFNNLENLGRDRGIFKTEFPYKTHLKKIDRREKLLVEINGLFSKKFVINPKVINLESNIGFEVLERNFYKLNIPLEELRKHVSFLNKLLNKRNDIAHNGLIKKCLSKKEYMHLLEEVKEFLEDVISVLKKYILEEKYKSNG